MTADEIVSQVRSEWWKQSSRETFASVADELLHGSMSGEDVLNILDRLYGAVADEYGD